MQVPAGTLTVPPDAPLAEFADADVDAVVLEPLLPQADRTINPAVATTAARERRVQLVIAREGSGFCRRIGLGRVAAGAEVHDAHRERTRFPVRVRGVPTGHGTCNPFGR